MQRWATALRCFTREQWTGTGERRGDQWISYLLELALRGEGLGHILQTVIEDFGDGRGDGFCMLRGDALGLKPSDLQNIVTQQMVVNPGFVEHNWECREQDFKKVPKRHAPAPACRRGTPASRLPCWLTEKRSGHGEPSHGRSPVHGGKTNSRDGSSV